MGAAELLAKNVRRLRAAKGWSQEEAASAAGIHPTYWSQLETAKRNPSLLIVDKLTAAFGVSPAELFGVTLAGD